MNELEDSLKYPQFRDNIAFLYSIKEKYNLPSLVCSITDLDNLIGHEFFSIYYLESYLSWYKPMQAWYWLDGRIFIKNAEMEDKIVFNINDTFELLIPSLIFGKHEDASKYYWLVAQRMY